MHRCSPMKARLKHAGLLICKSFAFLYIFMQLFFNVFQIEIAGQSTSDMFYLRVCKVEFFFNHQKSDEKKKKEVKKGLSFPFFSVCSH